VWFGADCQVTDADRAESCYGPRSQRTLQRCQNASADRTTYQRLTVRRRFYDCRLFESYHALFADYLMAVA